MSFAIGAPIIVLASFLGGAVAYGGLRRAPVAARAPSALAGRFFTDYLLWLIAPIERRLPLAPNAITLVSFAVAVAAAVLIACGWYAVAAWAVTLSGVLDILDGRVARRTGRTSHAGAFLDSVTDRWGELVITGALVFALRDSTFGLAAALANLGGAQMVSYTRSRGEALGIELHGGTMQRPERIVALTAALLFGGLGRETAWFDGELAMAIILGVVGVWTCITALQRLHDGMRALGSTGYAQIDHSCRPQVTASRGKAPIATRHVRR
jgi:phosphatidylglycerophosphate synthase